MTPKIKELFRIVMYFVSYVIVTVLAFYGLITFYQKHCSILFSKYVYHFNNFLQTGNNIAIIVILFLLIFGSYNCYKNYKTRK
jgi:hypothetical protein